MSTVSHLFTGRGYGRTTIDAIAEQGGVSRRVVFTAVGGKLDLLKLALHWAVAGDDEPVPLAAPSTATAGLASSAVLARAPISMFRPL